MNVILRAKASFIYTLSFGKLLDQYLLPLPQNTKNSESLKKKKKKPNQPNNYKKKKMQDKHVPSEHLTHPGITATSGAMIDKRPRSQDPQL